MLDDVLLRSVSHRHLICVELPPSGVSPPVAAGAHLLVAWRTVQPMTYGLCIFGWVSNLTAMASK